MDKSNPNFADPTPPSVPDHEILHLIGRGSYGTVWLARNVMGGWRAVKFVQRSSFGSDRPFEREFSGIRRYEPISRSNEGLVQILHVGRNDAAGYFYYVMELADAAPPGPGEAISEIYSDDRYLNSVSESTFSPASYSPRSLRADLDRMGRLPIEECIGVGLALANGLAHLHRHGLIHRDIKPSNIIFVNGRAKLADLGLVGEASESRSFVGTEGFIPPEGPGSASADLFALGKVLYEGSTGLDQDNFPDLPDDWVRGEMPAGALDFHEIILKACEGDRSRRYESAAELHADLALLQSGRSVRRVHQLERRLRLFRRAVIVASFALLIGAVGSALFAWQARVQRENFERSERLRLRAENAEHSAREEMVNLRLTRARAQIDGGRPGRRTEALADLEQVARARPGDAEARDLAIAALALPEVHDAGLIPVSFGMAVPRGRTFEFSRALDRFAFIDASDRAHVRGLSNIVEKSPPIAALLGPFCSDGSRLSIWNPILNRWQIWAPETDRLWLGPREAERDDALAFRSDGKAVFATADTGIVEFEFESQSYAKRYATPFRPAVLIASGDGGRLAIGDGTRRHLAVLDSHNGDSLFVREMPAGAEYWTLMLSDNGFWLAASARDFTVHAWPIDGEVQTGLTLKGHQAEVAGLAFDPNCEHLITSSWDGTTRWWSIATGQIEIREETWGSPLRIGLDGRRVARLTTIGTNGACARLQTIERSEVYRCFGEPVPRGNLDLQKGPWHVDFLEDGRFLATASYDGVRIWDAFRGDPLAHLPLEAGFSALWLKAKRSVVTTGGGRLETWPMRTNRDGGFILGPRELVATGSDALYTASALDGRRLFARIGVEVAGFESDARWTAARAPYIRFAASPDGRWLVGSEYHSSDAALTDANTGIIVRRFPANVLAGAAFQPDGKRVIISCRDEISSLSVPEGSVLWRSPRQDASAGGPIAIDGEGRMIAAGITTRRLALLDATDGRILAEFTPPTPEPLTWIAFSPDGGNLAATTTSHITHLWDLRALRKALAGMGLDWNEPAQLPATAMPPATKIQITLTGASAKREADSPMPR